MGILGEAESETLVTAAMYAEDGHEMTTPSAGVATERNKPMRSHASNYENPAIGIEKSWRLPHLRAALNCKSRQH